MQSESCIAPDKGKVISEDCMVEEVGSIGGVEANEMHPSSDDGVLAVSPQKVEGSPILTNHQIDDPMVEDIVERTEQAIPSMERVSMEVDVISNLAEEDAVQEELSKFPTKVEGSYELVADDLTTTSNALVEDENHSDSRDGNEEMKLVDAKCGPLVYPDVSSEEFEVVVPIESESGSVILSRIHHSPESTH